MVYRCDIVTPHSQTETLIDLIAIACQSSLPIVKMETGESAIWSPTGTCAQVAPGRPPPALYYCKFKL